MASILVFCPYPYSGAPSQRFRFEQYLDILRDAGHDVTVSPFLPTFAHRIIYRQGHLIRKMSGVLFGFMGRLLAMTQLWRYDYIFVHREASPIGPPIFEAIASACHRRTILDFDDAIFVPRISVGNKIVWHLKWFSKTRFTCKHFWKVAVCNPYLQQWVLPFNKNVVLLPTTIDLKYHRRIVPSTAFSRPTIGWTGSRSTVEYLEVVRKALVQLSAQYEFEFIVICDVDPKLDDIPNYRFIRWTLEKEIEDLSQIQIGLMPVPAGEWEMGKVGFKAIQYSGVEAVPVVSATGSGHEVVIDGETGFVVENTTEAWLAALSKLLAAPETMMAMGGRAREYIRLHYSVEANTATFLNLFTER